MADRTVPEPRLKSGDVARLTGLSRAQVQRWATDGRIHGERLPSNRWSFRRSDIEHLIPADRQDAAA